MTTRTHSLGLRWVVAKACDRSFTEYQVQREENHDTRSEKYHVRADH